MANIITEIYVSLDGEKFVKLDLYKDESINMKYTQKDLQNLSKIFAPYSQGFTFPATPKNRAAFGFFGDTDVIKINKDNKFTAKSYIDGVLDNTGYIKLSGVSYKNNKPSDFKGSLVSTMTNLKDRIGEDLISELADEDALVKWSIQGVQDMIRSQQTMVVNGVEVKYFAPLISVNRVWGYDPTNNNNLLDNIAYNQSSDLKGNNLIRPEDLRPCVSYSSIINLIKTKYDINVISPVEEREEFLDARVWCNSEIISDTGFKVLPIYNQFGQLRHYDGANENRIPDPKKYTITANLQDNSFEVYKDPVQALERYEGDGFFFKLTFSGVVISGGTETPTVDVQYIRKSDDAILKTENFEIDSASSSFICESLIDDAFFGASDYLEFYIKVKFNQPTSWSSCKFRIWFRYYHKFPAASRTRHANYYYDSVNNNNSNEVSSDDVDLFKSLPNIKVVDFLNSHFKSFNISVFDTSPDNNTLYWLTPEDVNSEGKVYSKAVLDYTKYLDSRRYEKETPNDFNYYNFKHATSEYFSNKKYAEAFGLEYGQTVYPDVKPSDLNEFKVETSFSIVPPVNVNGAAGVVTLYGFTDETPEVIDTGETRYTPNYDELTIFYTHGSTNCAALGLLGVIQVQVSPLNFVNQIGVYSLTSYIKVLPWSKSGKSFAFSILKDNNLEYTDTLYSRYYAAQTIRLLDPNVLSQKFSLILPPNEIYLNESTTIQNAGDTPSGFRLQNDIIIGENIFSIIDATIDKTTGKTKMTLLNY